jgi:long-chain-fatty-acid--CoA ligase ACSBG
VSHHSKVEIVVLEGNKQLEKYAQTATKLPKLKVIVVYDAVVNPIIAEQCGVPVHGWDDFLLLGKDVKDEVIDTRAAVIKPVNCVSLIYTSGTTGQPKAVMVSLDNITWTARNVCDHYVDLNHTDRVISYLPLSHIAAQMIDMHCMMVIGGCAYFAQAGALKGSLTASMREIKPTFFFGVPRVWRRWYRWVVPARISKVYRYLSQGLRRCALRTVAVRKCRRCLLGIPLC